jgi:Phage integrase, N-terminal SAM-like domain
MSDAASQDLAARAQQRDERQKTRHRGISFRETTSGRSYYVFAQGRYFKAARPSGKRSRSRRPPRTFGTRPARRRPTEDQGAELFEQWFEGKTRLAPWTRKSYRDAIDLVLIPAFGSWQVAVIDADAVAKLIRGLEADGPHSLDAKRPGVRYRRRRSRTTRGRLRARWRWRYEEA